MGWNGERFDGKMCSQYWHYAGICQIQYRLYYLVNLRGEKLNLFTLTGPLKSNFATREPRRSLFSILTLFDYFEHSITSRCLLILFVCVPWYMLCRTVDIQSDMPKKHVSKSPAKARWRIKKFILDFLLLMQPRDRMTTTLPVMITKSSVYSVTSCSVLTHHTRSCGPAACGLIMDLTCSSMALGHPSPHLRSQNSCPWRHCPQFHTACSLLSLASLFVTSQSAVTLCSVQPLNCSSLNDDAC